MVEKIYGLSNNLVVEYNASDSRGINDILNIVKQTSEKYNFQNNNLNKLLILEEADGLPKSTQKVLLKFLTNKSCNINYILTCNNINEISKKLKSNYFIVKFKKLSQKQILINLDSILKKENIKYEFDVLRKICSYSNGDMRTGLNYLQSIANVYNEINEEYFYKILNLSNPLMEYIVLEICLQKDFYKLIEILDEIVLQGYSYNQIKLFFYDCINKINFIRLNIPDILRSKLETQIQLEKGHNSENIAQVYGFFAIIYNIINKFYP